MSEKIIIDYRLERDFIKKKTIDQEISGVLSIYPEANSFKNDIVTNNDLIFVLDTSGSMDEIFDKTTSKSKRTVLIEVVTEISKYLNPKDTISIISFNSNAIIHGNHLPGSAKAKINEAIEKLKYDNGQTDFGVAMTAAQKVANESKNDNIKIIFLTDGNSTAGNEKAFEIAKELADKGITMDSMGIGSDFNYDYMKGFSHFSNGLTENLTDSKKVKVIFSEIVKNAREVVAKRVFINLLFPKIFRDLEFYQISPEQRNFNNKISKSGNGSYIQLNMGDLEKNSQKEFLFVGSLDATDDDSFSVADIKVSFDIPSLNLKNQEKNMKVYLNFSDNLNDEKFDSNVSNYKKELQLLLQYDEVKELNKKNKPIEAVKKLEKMVEIAKEIGAFDKVRIYNDFIKKLKSNNNLTQEDLNNLSYASSRTSLASMRERNIEANTEDEDYF